FSNPPAAHTDAAGKVSATSATLQSTINPQGRSTTVMFQYTTTSGNYTSALTVTATPATFDGTSDVVASAVVSGLTPKTTYYYRVVETNSAGTTIGGEKSSKPGNATISLPLVRKL